MAEGKSFFSEFNSSTKGDWLEKVKKDLKGKALESLNFEVEEGLVLSPFFGQEDTDSSQKNGLVNFRQGAWHNGACFEVSDVKRTNMQLKEELEGGVNAPLLLLNQNLSAESIAHLYKGIEVAWVRNYFEGEEEVLIDFFDKWMTFLETQGTDLTAVKGNLGLSYLSEKVKPILAFAKKEMPDFSLFKIEEQSDVNYSTGLASLLKKAQQLFEQSDNVKELVTQIEFKLWVDKNYFASIAKLRAFHILWANFLKAYNCHEDRIPNISVHFAASIESDDEYQNMIHTATVASSAIIGGGTTIFIPSAANPATPLTRRMARNVNHILKMESYMDKVIDPAAGSYYVEALTGELAKRAWEKFQGE